MKGPGVYSKYNPPKYKLQATLSNPAFMNQPWSISAKGVEGVGQS